ncbi:MAG: hypothetical protein ABFE01_06165, partial [Phycisphaerales bacterium]
MRSSVPLFLIGAVLCACAAAAEQPAQFSPGDILIAASGDPNEVVPPAGSDPNKTWDPAKHLVADWESISVTMSSQIYNPARQPDGASQGPQWSLSVRGILDITDSSGLIGWSTTPASVKAYDQSGQEVASAAPSSSPVRWYQQPTSWSVPESFPSSMRANRFSLNLPVGPGVQYPDMFSRIEWAMNLVAADETKTFDVPFKAGETWVELTAGLEVLVEQATSQGGKYQYRIKTRFDPAKFDFLLGNSITLWQDQTLPPAAILKMDLLNADGKSMSSGSGSSSSSRTGSVLNGQKIVTATGSGTSATCGDAAI